MIKVFFVQLINRNMVKRKVDTRKKINMEKIMKRRKAQKVRQSWNCNMSHSDYFTKKM